MLEPEPRLPRFGFGLARHDQLPEHVFVDLPRAVLVGVGQCRAGWRALNAQMPESALAGRQPSGDLAQRTGSTQMAEQHRNKLTPARHPLGVLLTRMPGDCVVKNAAGYQPHNLTESAAYSFSGWVVPPVGFVLTTQLYWSQPALLSYTPLKWLLNVLDSSASGATDSCALKQLEQIVSEAFRPNLTA